MNKLIPSLLLILGLLTGCSMIKDDSRANDDYPDIDQDTSGAPAIEWDKTQDSLRTGVKTLDFYNVNDTHGAIELNGEEPGIAKISTHLKSKRNINPAGFVFTSSGDMWQGSADSNITRGALMMEWMDYEGCAAMALGNHEFDWSIDVLKDNQTKAKHKFLACNIIEDSTNKPVDWVEPYTTITRNGVHIGIIGAIGMGIEGSILASNVRGLTFDNPNPYVAKWSKFLKENGADVILYLYHESTDAMSSSLGNYVDAAFGAHNHSLEKRTLDNGVPAVEGLCNGRYVSHITLNYDFSTSSCSYGSSGYNPVYTSLDDNPEVVAIKNKYAEQINAIKNEEIADLPYSFSQYSDIPLLYDRYAYKYYDEVLEGEKDIKFVVTNNARATLNAGVVTYGDLYKALPFDNYLTVCYGKGSDILSDMTTYSSSRWYFPEEGDSLIDRNYVYEYINSNEYYYFLSIDYVVEYEGYTSWIDIQETYRQEDALPRNLLKRYLGEEYPLS
ncbi:MAG: 5'-nucleotidase C-terminal domain-containing protein [Bacilli bacterium]|nr:5'-nucleotidase C-terminal domain-containing protein [Bacilli bacterium]